MAHIPTWKELKPEKDASVWQWIKAMWLWLYLRIFVLFEFYIVCSAATFYMWIRDQMVQLYRWCKFGIRF